MGAPELLAPDIGEANSTVGGLATLSSVNVTRFFELSASIWPEWPTSTGAPELLAELLAPDIREANSTAGGSATSNAEVRATCTSNLDLQCGHLMCCTTLGNVNDTAAIHQSRERRTLSLTTAGLSQWQKLRRPKSSVTAHARVSEDNTGSEQMRLECGTGIVSQISGH